MIQELRKRPEYVSTPIFVLTSDATITRAEEGKKAGADAWMVKPMPPDLLWKVIEHALFGRPLASSTNMQTASGVPTRVAKSFELGWSALKDDMLPVELVVHQLPQRLTAEGRHYQFSFCPIIDGSRVSNVVIVISDITSAVERERVEAQHSELVAILHHVMKDRAGFVEFVDEANEIVRVVSSGAWQDKPELLRHVHTLKGNCLLVGIASFSRYCHELESRLLEGEDVFAKVEQEQFQDAWRKVITRLAMFIGSHATERIEITSEEYQGLKAALASAAPYEELCVMVEEWAYESAALRLERMAGHASALARRLEKGELRIVIEDNALRLAHAKWSRFWSAFVHVLRNAVDHGLESPDERLVRGKPTTCLISLRTAVIEDDIVVEIRDDGRGIDWKKIGNKARQLGLPADTHADRVEALFATGLSSRDEATEISGRGLGMGASRDACRELEGSIEIESTLGIGTLIRFRIPCEKSAPLARCSARSSRLEPKYGLS
jgi:two-component system chemotaxis sensor kinase CheA